MKYYEFEKTKYPVSYYLSKEDYLLTKREESFFIWNNSEAIVIGKNQILEDEVNIKKANLDKVNIYRRKSGGGAVYADEGCFMFSFIVKRNSIDKIYEYCLNKVCKVLNQAGAKVKLSGRNDLLIDDAKISGNAIYLKDNYAVMHGTILFNSKLDKISDYLTPNKEKLAKNKVKSVSSRVTNLISHVKYKDKYELMAFMEKHIGKNKGSLFESEQKVIEKMASKYEDERWIYGKAFNYNYKITKRLSMGEMTFMAKASRRIIEEAKIYGDFFENYDLKTLENNFVGVKLDNKSINDLIDRIDVSKYVYGLSNEEFKTLFVKESTKKVKKEEVKMENKVTCLYKNHLDHGGKIVEFGGFLMPIEYKGITEEHLAVRGDAGIFDCSHMGEFMVTGEDAIEFLNYVLTSNIASCFNNEMKYGLLLYKNGTVVDDLMVYKVNNNKCMLVVNAANIAKDWDYLNDNIGMFKVKLEDFSSECGEIALQGVKAKDYLQKLTSYDLDTLKYSHFDYFEIDGRNYNVSRSGYTGSDGFEIYGKCEDIVALFEKLISIGVTPCGLGARDTLRFEAAMPLYGHEISDAITPLEAGLSFACDFEKGDFLGKDALVKQKEKGLDKKIVGLELLERGIARGGYKIFKDGAEVGYITTGYMIPETNNSYALGLINYPYYKMGEELEVAIRNRMVKIKIRNKKLLKKGYVR